MALHTQPLPQDLTIPAPRPAGDASTVRTPAAARARRLASVLWGPGALGLAGFSALCAIPVVISAAAVDTGPGTWFDALPKHDLVRTEWLFGRIDIALHALLVLSGWLVWRRDWPEPERRRALAVLGAQLVISSWWAPVLFGAHALDLALLVASAGWLATLGLLTTLAPANRLAAVLAVPMLAWATYAVAVNAVLVVSG